MRHDTAAAPTTGASSPEGKTSPEAMRCLRRRLSDVVFRQLVADADRPTRSRRAREGTGRRCNPARPTSPPDSGTSTSHFPDPRLPR
jgi:hypothetical protein